LNLPKGAATIKPPAALPSASDASWPSVGIVESFFDKALTASANGETSAGTGAYQTNGGDTGARTALDDWAGEDEVMEEEARSEDDVAWDIAEEEPAPVAAGATAGAAEDAGSDAAEEEEAAAEAEEVTPGISEATLWARNSPLAADHIAAGSFETAMQLLNRQIGAVEFKPLKTLFLNTYASSKLYIDANASMPPLAIPIRRDPAEKDPRKVLPVSTKSLQSVTQGELKAAYTAFNKAKFQDCLDIFKGILHSLLVIVAQSAQEETDVSSMHCGFMLGTDNSIRRSESSSRSAENIYWH